MNEIEANQYYSKFKPTTHITDWNIPLESQSDSKDQIKWWKCNCIDKTNCPYANVYEILIRHKLQVNEWKNFYDIFRKTMTIENIQYCSVQYFSLLAYQNNNPDSFKAEINQWAALFERKEAKLALLKAVHYQFTQYNGATNDFIFQNYKLKIYKFIEELIDKINPPPTHSYNVLNRKNEENFEGLLNKLKNGNMIHRDTTLPKFKKIFSNIEISKIEKCDWISDLGSLVYFISLFKLEKYRPQIPFLFTLNLEEIAVDRIDNTKLNNKKVDALKLSEEMRLLLPPKQEKNKK